MRISFSNSKTFPSLHSQETNSLLGFPAIFLLFVRLYVFFAVRRLHSATQFAYFISLAGQERRRAALLFKFRRHRRRHLAGFFLIFGHARCCHYCLRNTVRFETVADGDSNGYDKLDLDHRGRRQQQPEPATANRRCVQSGPSWQSAFSEGTGASRTTTPYVHLIESTLRSTMLKWSGKSSGPPSPFWVSSPISACHCGGRWRRQFRLAW